MMLRAYFGHHKCGSSWVSRILDDMCNRAGLVRQSFDNAEDVPASILNGETPADLPDFWVLANGDGACLPRLPFKMLHVVRDPRDVLVSGYFSHLKSHPADHWPELQAHRKNLANLPQHRGLMAELEFSQVFFVKMRSMISHLAHPSVLTMSYEELLANEVLGFLKAFKWLEILEKVPVYQGMDVIRANTFSAQTKGRTAGRVDTSSHLRKGVAGDWRNYFDQDLAAAFSEQNQDLLEAYGYEYDRDWVSACPKRSWFRLGRTI